MSHRFARRWFLRTAAALPTLGLPRSLACGDENPPPATATLAGGALRAVVRDNSESPRMLSGLDSLVHRDAGVFDAFDPDSPGASAGLNFEHIISGHKNAHNAFAPRHGPYRLEPAGDGLSATLVRRREDDPWAMSSRLTYTLAPPQAIDIDFRCVPHDGSLFGARGYAILFFANYMHDVADLALNFRGIAAAGQDVTWIRADAPRGHRDWNQGGTYRHVAAEALEYDPELDFRLNSWSYDYPRFVEPFYFGRMQREMALILMFDKAHSADDEIRFSLFKFKTPRFPRPAWDFQYVIHRVASGREYGFKARLVWKKFVSPDDCRQEWLAWSQANKS